MEGRITEVIYCKLYEEVLFKSIIIIVSYQTGGGNSS